MAVNQVATLGVKVDPRGAVTGASRAKKAITGIGKTASNVKNRIMSMQGALLGLGAGAVLKSIITTASSVESLRVRLKFLTGSTEEAAKAFDIMNEFASKVPFSLEDIERASPLLLTVAKSTDELNELLAITGDIAAISGLSFEATAGQLQRAMSGGIAAADLFRERGVKAFLGFEEGVQFSAEETTRHIKKIFREGTTTAKGATTELADTFQGQVSMMEDAFRKLKLAVADAGVFEMTAKVVQNLTEMLASPATIQNMKTFGETITFLGTGMGNVFSAFMSLPEWVRNTGLIMAFLGGKKARLLVAGLTLVVTGIKEITAAVEDFKKKTNKIEKLEKSISADKKEFLELRDLIAHTKTELAKYIAIRDNALQKPAGMSNSSTFGKLEQREITLLTVMLNSLERDAARLGLTIKVSLDQIKQLGNQSFPTLGEQHSPDVMMADGSTQRLTRQRVEVDKLTNTYQNLSHNAHQAFSAIDIMSAKLIKPENGLHGMLDVVDDLRVSFDASIHPTEIMGMKFDELATKAKEAQEKIKEFADSLATNIENSIMRMTKGLMSFKDVVKSVFQFVANEMVKQNIARPLAGALSTIFAGTSMGQFSAGVGVPTFATGGRPTAGQPSIVGERGAELFVPDRAGTVVPNGQFGGQTINVTYSPQVNALDPRTAQLVIAENAPTIVGVVRQAFERNGQMVAL